MMNMSSHIAGLVVGIAVMYFMYEFGINVYIAAFTGGVIWGAVHRHIKNGNKE